MKYRLLIILLTSLPFLLSGQERSYMINEIKLGEAVTSVSVSPDGRLVLYGLNNGSLGVLNDSSGARELELKEVFPKAVNAIMFSPKMDFIFAAGGNVIKLFRPDGYQVAQWKAHPTTIWNAVLSSDGKYALSSEFNKTFRLWDVYNGEVIENMRAHDDVTLAVAFSPDTRLLASGSADRTIKIWDRDSLAVLRTLNGHGLEIYDLKFSPDGSTLASASKDKSIRIWDVQTGSLLHLLKGHTNYVLEVAFTPDGRYLLSASTDQTIRLWDVAGGDEIYSFIANDAAITDLAVMPGGNSFYSASMDEYIRKWALDPEIFVLRYFGDDYRNELSSNHLFDERRKGESKSDFEARMRTAEKKRVEIVGRYYAKYLERFVEPAQ